MVRPFYPQSTFGSLERMNEMEGMEFKIVMLSHVDGYD